MLLIQFAHAMLVVSKMDNQNGIDQLPNSKYTQRIKRRAEGLERSLSDTFSSNIKEVEDVKWFKRKLDTKLLPLLQNIQDTKIELVSFANYLLYINFADNRKKVISPMFEKYVAAEQYFSTLDLIEKVTGKEYGEMYDLAIKSKNFLKS